MVKSGVEATKGHSLLPRDDLSRLSEPKEIRVGYPSQLSKDRTFIIRVDAGPLARLIEDAGKGQRMYELLSIERPGDILHYLWVKIPDRSSSQAEYVVRQRNAFVDNLFRDPIGDVCELGFVEFDKCYPLLGDDTTPDADLWRKYVNTEAWRQYPTELMTWVRRAQDALKQCNDYLVQHEIALMRRGQHHLDFSPKVPRFCDREPSEETVAQMPASEQLPTALFDLIVNLAQKPDVSSVSCPFQDYWLWRELVAEQIRRCEEMGVEPQKALSLNGPDSGIPTVSSYWHRTDLEWGGEIHIPYEGTCGGDLFIHPKWFGFAPDNARTAPTLSQAVFGNAGLAGIKTCKYLLTPLKKLGEIASATRAEVGDWVLYSATSPQPIEDVTD